MKKIIIQSQEEFDKINRIEADEEVVFEAEKIRINCVLTVLGRLRLSGKIDSSWDGRYIESRGSSQNHIVSRGSSQNHIESWESSQNHIVSRESSQNHIVSRESSQNHIVSRESSQNRIVSRESSQNHIVSRESSQNRIVSRELSQNHIESWGSSQNHIESRESSQNHIESWESSQNHIVSRESSQNHIKSLGSSQNHIESWNMSINTAVSSITSASLGGFSCLLIPFDLKIKIKKSKTAKVQRYKKEEKYLEREGIAVNKGKVVLFKRVSKDYKTQEGTSNETTWSVGELITHPKWNPGLEECGAGKFHACSRPFFCDEFRNEEGDRYIAIEIAVKDLYEWKNPSYPHKIAFRKGKVLYECDRYGNKI